jgi:hypothetical protein
MLSFLSITSVLRFFAPDRSFSVGKVVLDTNAGGSPRAYRSMRLNVPLIRFLLVIVKGHATIPYEKIGSTKL